MEPITVESFNDQPSASLADFAVESDKQGLITSAGATNIAAHAAALADPQALAENYTTIRSDLETLGTSATANQIMSKATEQDAATEKAAFVSVVSDPTLPSSVKEAAAKRYLEQQNTRYTSLQKLTSIKALASPIAGENPEQENIRLNLATELDSINQLKRDKQSAMHTIAASGSSDTRDVLVEFVSQVIPFVHNARVSKIISDYNKATGDDATQVGLFESMTMSGWAKQDFKAAFEKMPVDKQRDLVGTLVTAVQNSKSPTAWDNTDMTAVQAAQAFLEDGSYGNIDAFIDNLAGVLDIVGAGALLKRPAKAILRGVKPGTQAGFEAVEETLRARKQASAADAFARAKAEVVRTEVQPVSLMETYKDVNPAQYKATYKAIVSDEAGEISEAMAGTSRAEAIASAHTPEQAAKNGEVEARPTDVEGDNVNRVAPEAPPKPDFGIDETISTEINTSGKIHLTANEKDNAVQTVVNDFQSATGITARHEMTTVADNATGGKTISAVYGNGSYGFSNAADAIELAKVSLRKYGVQDSDIQLLKRSGDKYVPADIKTASGNGDYLVRVNYDYGYDVHQMDMDTLTVKKNFFDRLPIGTPLSLDPASTFDPVIFMGANVAVDKGSRLQRNLLEMGKEFTDKYVKLDKGGKDKVWNFILEANEKGIGLSPLEIAKYSFTPAEKETLKKWRRYWDNQYHLENRDAGKTLQAQGYKVLEEPTGNTRLFAREIQQHKVGREDVYNPITGGVAPISGQDLTDLYTRGGTVAKLRTPALVNGDYVGYIISENKAGSSYLRAIVDTDAVLNYRKGYFQVRYKGPKFLVERIKNKRGEVIGERAIASSSNTRDAFLAGRRQAASTGKIFGEAKDLKADYYVRSDAKLDRNVEDEHMFDSQASAGRTAQRLRGKPLRDASSPTNFGPQYNHIVSPVDSLIHAAGSIAKRTSMRDYLTATKERAVQQYGHYFPRDEFGRPTWPTSRGEIGAKGDQASKGVADARATYDYIASLENAAANAVDDFTRAFLNGIAEIFGDLSTRSGKASKALSLMEQGLRKAGDLPGPTTLLKSAGNAAFIALNPLRQIVLQPSQTIMLLANYPKSAPQAIRDLAAFLMYKTHPSLLKGAAKNAGRTEAEMLEIIRQADATGLAAGVDSHSLVSGSLSQMAEMSRYSGKRFPIISGAIRKARQIGFDAGETINILSTFFTIRDDAVRRGVKLDAAGLDQIQADARNYTGNMNQAGEMKFARGTFGVLTQYMQQPFKSAMAVTNRSLTRAEKARLLGMQAILFPGIGLWVWESFFDKLPDDKDGREILEEGLQGYLFNHALSLFSDKEVHIDFRSLAPANMYGSYEVIHNLVTMDIMEALANTPSGQLLLGSSPRITDAWRQAARFFHHVDDETAPKEFLKTVQGFLSISSGFSNMAKARYMWSARQKLNSMGGVTVEDVGKLEAAFAAFGFPTMQEAKVAELNQQIYLQTQAHKDDITEYYKQMKRMLNKEGIANEDPRFIQRVLTEIYRYDDSFATREMIQGLIKKDMRDKDGALFNRLIELSKLPDTAKTRETLGRVPDPQMRKQALEALDEMDAYFKEQQDNK